MFICTRHLMWEEDRCQVASSQLESRGCAEMEPQISTDSKKTSSMSDYLLVLHMEWDGQMGLFTYDA